MSSQATFAFTVVVCTRDRPAELERCLETLTRLRYPRYEVLVVDNASRDPHTCNIARRHGASYLLEPVPGLSRARNSGARAATADLIAYIDDDAVPEPDWLSALAREFDDPHVMAVTGRALSLDSAPASKPLATGIGEPDFGSPERLSVDAKTPYWFEMANFGGLGVGRNMAFRRQAFEGWPGFDERLGRGALLEGCEEHKAFFELMDLGYRVVYTPAAVVRHPPPASFADLRARQLKSLTASAGYLMLLLVEKQRYRNAVLTYLRQALTGTRRSWRPPPSTPRPRIAPWWRVMLASLAGPVLYARSRLTQARPGGT
ncbi:MAG: glycosyltransferase [Candidatus Acidiferrales bacterium]